MRMKLAGPKISPLTLLYPLTGLVFHLFVLTSGVRIRHSTIPSTFDITHNSTLFLDCDYTYNENDLYLVVRWFHQGSADRPDPIYQWIPERRVRHVAEDYKSVFDYEYVSDASDPYTMYRSIVLHNPMPSMSGKYKCRISSLADADSREGNVFIYASPKMFIFTSRVDPVTGNLHLQCIARQTFPLPEIKLYKKITPSAHNSIRDNGNKVNSESSQSQLIVNVNKSISSPEPFYDVTLSYILSDQELLKTALTRSQTIFECHITINNTNYSSIKRITLYSNRSTSEHPSIKYSQLILWCLTLFGLIMPSKIQPYFS